MHFFKKNSWYIMALIFLAIITHVEWFDIDSTLFFGDWRYRSDMAVSQIADMLGRSTWISFYNFGEANIQLYSFPMTYIWGLLGNYAVAVKLTMLWPIAFLSLLAPYSLLKYLFKKNRVAFLGALVYGFNTYIIIKTIGHLNIAFVYVLAPLIILFWHKFLKKYEYKDLIIFILLYTLGIIYEIRIVYIINFVLLLFTIPYATKFFLYRKKVVVMLVLLLILLNIFWIVPILTIGSGEISTLANRGLWGDDLFTLNNALALFDWHWTGSEPMKRFINQPVKYYLLIIPIISMVPLILTRSKIVKKNRKNIGIFYLILFVGILLSKQSSEPFSELYLWLYKHFPGFNLFRLANKFYILLALGYSALYGLGGYILINRSQNKRIRTAILALLIFVPMLNAKPMITGEIETMYIDREKPQEYSKLEQLISRDENIFRTLYVPIYSQWGYYDIYHPKIAMWQVLNKAYAGQDQFARFTELKPGINNFTNPNLYMGMLSAPYGQDVLRASGIKYVVVPMQLPESEDRIFPYAGERFEYVEAIKNVNYLSQIQNDDITIFKNSQLNEYIDTSRQLFLMEDDVDLRDYFLFLKQSKIMMDGLFNFTTQTLNSNYEIEKKVAIAGTSVMDPLGNLTFENLEKFKIKSVSSREWNESLYLNKGKKELVLDVADNQLVLKDVFQEYLFVDGQKVFEESILDNNKILYTTELEEGRQYYLKNGSNIVSVGSNIALNENLSLGIYKTQGVNAIQNGSFEGGLWSDAVGDCNDYDDNGLLSMRQSSSASDGSASLELQATRHIACTNKRDIPVESDGEYLLSFDYQSDNAQQAGFYLSFQDSGKTISEKLPISDEQWRKYSRVVTVPSNVDKVTLYVYSYEEDGERNVITRYDNFNLQKLELLKEIQPDKNDDFIKVDLPNGGEEYHFEYKDGKYDYHNLIINGSLEDGLWKRGVSDCNNYDKKPVIDMVQAEVATDGKKSLELQATRHIACTSPNAMSVKGGVDYLLEFDYQSDNGRRAGFNFGFNDEEKTNVNEKIDIKKGDGEWHTFSKKITVPAGASSANLTVYSYAKDKKTNIITRYDNFKFIELPDLNNRYYLVSEPEVELVKPASVEFDLINPTKKLVHISGATKPFYLTMSESYHDKWQAQLNNSKVHGFFGKWVPFVHPDTIADDKHFKYMTFLNGWYVDPQDLCGGDSDMKKGCTKNDDGSYDIEMVIEFTPQRYFYLGLLISGTTFVSLISYLIWDFIKRRRRKIS